MIAVSVFMSTAVRLHADENVERAELPKLVDMPVPTADELFTADEQDKEYDWVVLKASKPEDRMVVVVQALFL